MDSFTATIYLNDDHDYVDAVETIMRKTFTRRRSALNPEGGDG